MSKKPTTQPKTPNEPYGLWKLREAAEHTLAVLAGGDDIEPGSRIEKWTRHALEAYAEELPRILPSSCSSSHAPIRYTGDKCPLCEALKLAQDIDLHAATREGELHDRADRLELAVIEAAEKFREYARLHTAKMTPGGDRKASENAAMAMRLSQALESLSRPSEAPAPKQDVGKMDREPPLPGCLPECAHTPRDWGHSESGAPAPKPCFCGGRAVLGPLPQDGGDAEVQFVHATGCPRDVGPGAGEEGK